MKKKIPVAELRFGMYVSDLDRPWSETPFPLQGVLLTTEDELETLQKLCEYVFVDVERDREAIAIRHEPSAPGDRAATMRLRGNTTYPEKVTVEVELKQARSVYRESAPLIEDFSRSAKSGKVLEAHRVKEAASRVVESVVRNPDAMLLVTKLREKSAYTISRALDVSIYMVTFGRFLQRSPEELELLSMLGLLQDVGMVRLPNELLEKKERLSPQEFELAKKHVGYSVEILSATPGIPLQLLELVTLHHERYDGSGYPKGLKGEEIGLYGSIAAIVDTFGALTLQRPYAEDISPSSALGLLYKQRGTHFHPALVEQFIQCVGVFPVGCVVELNTGEVGIVIAQNPLRRLKPRVMVVLDAKGYPMRPHLILDLNKEPMSVLKEPYQIRRALEHSKLELDPRELTL